MKLAVCCILVVIALVVTIICICALQVSSDHSTHEKRDNGEIKMSYDISLCDPVTHEPLKTAIPHMMQGGTYAIGGTTEMWLNITWNYGQWYRKEYAFGENGIRTIYGLSGAESIPVLQKAINGLTQSKENLSEEEIREYIEHEVTGYWLPTRENAIKPLYQLMALAQMRLDGIWEGD